MSVSKCLKMRALKEKKNLLRRICVKSYLSVFVCFELFARINHAVMKYLPDLFQICAGANSKRSQSVFFFKESTGSPVN